MLFNRTEYINCIFPSFYRKIRAAQFKLNLSYFFFGYIGTVILKNPLRSLYPFNPLPVSNIYTNQITLRPKILHIIALSYALKLIFRFLEFFLLHQINSPLKDFICINFFHHHSPIQ